MLHDFLTSNRRELISRCKAKVAKRSPKASSTDDPGVPLFLQQLADFLYREHLAGRTCALGLEPSANSFYSFSHMSTLISE